MPGQYSRLNAESRAGLARLTMTDAELEEEHPMLRGLTPQQKHDFLVANPDYIHRPRRVTDIELPADKPSLGGRLVKSK
jgi:hypothetical protein